MHTRAPSRSAFTLVELVAVVSIVAVIALVGGAIIQRAAVASTQITVRGSLYAETSAALDRVSRQIQRTPTRLGTAPALSSITSLNAAAIVWDNQSMLMFNPADSTLVLRDTASGDSPLDTPVLATGVTSLTLTPQDATGTNLFTALGTTTLTSPQAGGVQRVVIQLTLTRDGQSVSLRSRAFLRCRMAKAVSP